MSDEKVEKVEEAAEEAVEAKEEATETVKEAEGSVEEAKEAAEKVEEVKEEIKEEVKVEKAPTIAPKADVGVPTESVGEEKPAPSGKYKEIIEKIESLSVLELAELVKDLEERFGVSASAPMMAMSPAGEAATGAPAEEEKSSYDLILASGGDKKIQVIKAVREIKPNLGLKEAKDLVDGAPKELAKGMKKEDAEEAKKKLEAAGATVELK